MTLLGFVSHERVQWIESIFIFGIGAPASTLFMLTFLLALLLRVASHQRKTTKTSLRPGKSKEVVRT